MSEGRSLELFENDSRVTKAVDFLALNKRNGVEIDENAVHLVIGGGDVAMDVVTSLKIKVLIMLYVLQEKRQVNF